jgi:hypothetical protein
VYDKVAAADVIVHYYDGYEKEAYDLRAELSARGDRVSISHENCIEDTRALAKSMGAKIAIVGEEG